MTEDEWIPSRVRMDVVTECLYAIAPIAILILLAAVPFGRPQLSWDKCFDVYGPASESTETLHGDNGRTEAAHLAKARAIKPLNSL